jgi:hypothetical protein
MDFQEAVCFHRLTSFPVFRHDFRFRERPRKRPARLRRG